MKVATVRVEDKNTKYGYRIINEDDFDSKKHKLYEEKPPAKKSATEEKKDKK